MLPLRWTGRLNARAQSAGHCLPLLHVPHQSPTLLYLLCFVLQSLGSTFGRMAMTIIFGESWVRRSSSLFGWTSRKRNAVLMRTVLSQRQLVAVFVHGHDVETGRIGG